MKANNQVRLYVRPEDRKRHKHCCPRSEENMDQEMLRIDFINAIASKLQGAEPGRTALMKLAYFAQELWAHLLRLQFHLYSYGPFDSSVLSDLDVAQNMDAVTSK